MGTERVLRIVPYGLHAFQPAVGPYPRRHSRELHSKMERRLDRVERIAPRAMAKQHASLAMIRTISSSHDASDRATSPCNLYFVRANGRQFPPLWQRRNRRNVRLLVNSMCTRRATPEERHKGFADRQRQFVFVLAGQYHDVFRLHSVNSGREVELHDRSANAWQRADETFCSMFFPPARQKQARRGETQEKGRRYEWTHIFLRIMNPRRMIWVPQFQHRVGKWARGK